MKNLGRRKWIALSALVLAVVWLSATDAVGGSESGAESAPQARFSAAQSHFLEGRKLQKLHRNTEASRSEFDAAFDDFRGTVALDPDGGLAPRALYMSGSSKLFLDQPDAAISIYDEVVARYPRDRQYLAKALLKKAAVEKNTLQPAAARRTLERYAAEFPDGGPDDLRRERQRIEGALEVIGERFDQVAAARWFNDPTGVELDGRVTLLYFWASWCPNCKKEVDFVNDLWRRYEGRGLQLVGVTNHSRGQTDEIVERYVRENGFSFPVAVDAQGQTSRALRGGSVPTAVLIDRSGVVRWHDHPAALSDGVLDSLLSNTMAGAS